MNKRRVIAALVLGLLLALSLVEGLVGLAASVEAKGPPARHSGGEPDLVVTSLQTTCQRVTSLACLSGYQWNCRFLVQVGNQGGCSTGSGFDVWVYYAGRQVSGKPKTVPVGYLHFPALEPGEQAVEDAWFDDVACAVRYSAGPHAGLWGMAHWGVLACVEGAGAYADPLPDDIAESNENNNYRRVSTGPCAPQARFFVMPPSRSRGGSWKR